MKIIIIVAAIILIIEFIVFWHPDSSDSSDSTIKKKKKTPLSYSQIFQKYYDAGIALLKTMPGYTGDRFELMPFLCVVGSYALLCANIDPTKFSEEIGVHLEKQLLGPEIVRFGERVDFYSDVSSGGPAYGFWSVSDIPQSVLSVPMLRCAVAFGDCITNPDCIKDYENAPVLLWDITKQMEFTRIFSSQFYSFVKTYCTEIVGHDFTPVLLKM